MLFKGSGVALVTPFNEDLTINYERLEELINFHIESNTDAIIVCGTTGESSTLSTEEKKNVIKFSVQCSKNKIPIIAGTGSNNTESAVEMTKYAEKCGVDGVLVVTPYYNKCSQDGLYLHYKKIADNTSIPLILYNVPSRTGVNILPETVLRLSKIKNIQAIKEASSDISQIVKLASILPNNFYIYSGNDDQILPILSVGGKGVISVAANIFPNEIHNLCYSYFDDDISKAQEIQFKYLKLIKNLFSDVNPIPIKEAMNYLDFDVGPTRLPLSHMDREKSNQLKRSILKLYEKN